MGNLAVVADEERLDAVAAVGAPEGGDRGPAINVKYSN